MKAVIDELITILGIEVDEKAEETIKRVNGHLDSVTRFAAWAGAALLAAAASIAYFTQRSAESAAHVDKFSQLTGISTDKIQSMGYAALAAGGSVEGLESDLMGLTKSMSSPIPGEFNQTLFMMGIGVHNASGRLKTADELLLDIADRMKGMSAQRQIQWASRLGLSDDTLLMLKMGRSEIERFQSMARDLPVIVDEDKLKKAREFTTNLSLTKRMIEALGQTISGTAAPAIEELNKAFGDFVKSNMDFINLKMNEIINGIILGFRQFAGIIIYLKEKFNEAFPGASRFLDTLVNADYIADFVTTSLVALSAALVLLFPQWAALGAIIGVVSLAVNDFKHYLSGTESIIGDVLKSSNEMFKDFETRFPNIVRLAKDLWRSFKDIAELSWQKLTAGLGGLLGRLETVSVLLGRFMDFITQDIDKKIGLGYKVTDKIGLTGEGGFSLKEIVASLISAGITNISPGGALYTAISPGGGGSSSNTNSGNTVNVTQHISSPDPRIAGDEAVNKLGRIMDVLNFSGGPIPVGQ